MAGFLYRCRVNGQNQGQRVENTLWYTEIQELLADADQALDFRSQVVAAFIDKVIDSYILLPTSWVAPSVTINTYTPAGVKIDGAGLESQAAMAGVAGGEANGPGDYLVIRFDLSFSDVDRDPPRGGYIAWGPPVETNIQQNGQHTFNTAQRAQIRQPFEQVLTPLLSPIPGQDWFLKPVRVRSAGPPTPSNVAGWAAVVSTVLQPFASSRKSRRFPTAGGL